MLFLFALGYAMDAVSLRTIEKKYRLGCPHYGVPCPSTISNENAEQKNRLEWHCWRTLSQILRNAVTYSYVLQDTNIYIYIHILIHAQALIHQVNHCEKSWPCIKFEANETKRFMLYWRWRDIVNSHSIHSKWNSWNRFKNRPFFFFICFIDQPAHLPFFLFGVCFFSMRHWFVANIHES